MLPIEVIQKIKEYHIQFKKEDQCFNYTSLRLKDPQLISRIEKECNFNKSLFYSDINPLCHSKSLRGYLKKDHLIIIIKKLDSLGLDLSDNNLNKVIGKNNLWSLSFDGKIFYNLVKEEILGNIFDKSEFKECEECFPIWKISSFYAYCLRKFKRKGWSKVLNECNLNKHIKKTPSYSRDKLIIDNSVGCVTFKQNCLDREFRTKYDLIIRILCISLKEFNTKKNGIWFVKDLRKEDFRLYHAITKNFLTT